MTRPFPDLFHFTCDHGHQALGQQGEVKSGLLLSERVRDIPVSQYAWFTDLRHPIPDALGLTRAHVPCDRTAYRYRVTDATNVYWWMEVRQAFDRTWRQYLEGWGSRPAHWYVASLPVPVVFDPVPS